MNLEQNELNSPLSNLNFIFTWRPYQEKVLKNFDKFIKDNHFHVIAPPGSGKTILGLELIKRIGKKTLILTPTITVRNQWENRLQTFFTHNNSFTDFSFDIRKPKTLTFSTYQSLNSLYKSFENKNEYFNFFEEHNIDVLALDEAHHLKKEWWTCLYELKKQYHKTIVALTATPPYDSSNTEIKKYFSLCGEVDDEIMVPDLIKENNLCPHQDLVYLSEPLDYEINFIVNYRIKIANFIDALLVDTHFITFLKQHRFYQQTENNIDEIYQNIEYFSAILIFLNQVSEHINQEKLSVLGFNKNETIEFPKVTNNWIEILLQNLLVTDRINLFNKEGYLHELEKKLRKISAYKQNKVNLTGNKTIYKSLSSSPSKLNSICEIVLHEQINLKANLHCVILSDYIRKEYLNACNTEIDAINKLGILPIFHKLRKCIPHKNTIGVLTGSLVIIHESILYLLQEKEPLSMYSGTPLSSQNEFLIINSKSSKNQIVNSITELFESGDIKILIGTKSLLGEGWDAPSINSLILASVVGSFVTSNQMRGRAIRMHIKKPNKVGIIWHLACVDLSEKSGGKDLEILSRRFTAFLGITYSEKVVITNGFGRLQIPAKLNSDTIKTYNQHNFKKAKNRNQIKNNWNKAVSIGKSITQEILLLNQEKDKPATKTKIFYQDIVKYLSIEVIIGISYFLPNFIFKNLNIILNKGIVTFFFSLLSAFAFAFGYKIFTITKLYIRYGFIYKKIHKMALTILDTLITIKLITTDKNEILISTEKLSNGNISCNIQGANKLESQLFTNALDEILKPIENSKYLIVKTNWYRKKLNIYNFFAIPEIFSNNKKEALLFQENWLKHLGKSKLIYTRNKIGRRILLKARLSYIYNIDKKITKKNVIWK
ncbi:Helicase conserved C-terminal domain-containing protein [Polaribacter sp. KT25b]|uniref:DEAD/DEAH box helicase family protein n=1 Tax=Polaribacter sp. KT25b TaxID=1855336 RepID=UPI00087CF8DC|nr:DEAD/DEAH box helicase family protein [Polaribacter sp. KT25b]SDR78379.1 Helicase conserved C-terminal domain-containing protein [Polaribacter sp. KT25b]